jgi:hypothetical protein
MGACSFSKFVDEMDTSACRPNNASKAFYLNASRRKDDETRPASSMQRWSIDSSRWIGLLTEISRLTTIRILVLRGHDGVPNTNTHRYFPSQEQNSILKQIQQLPQLVNLLAHHLFAEEGNL